MRIFHGLFIFMAATVSAAAQSLSAPAKEPNPDAGAQPDVQDEDAKDTRLTLDDIRQLHHKRVPLEQIADDVAERGRAFEVTADTARILRTLGFSAAQFAAIKDASPDPLVPGKWVSYNEAGRDALLDGIKQATAKCGAAVQSAASQHATLWAAKGVQRKYLPDLQKAEKFFHTKCAEPIRSGTEPRTSHIVLLKDHAEYEAWWRAMFELHGDWFDEKDNPGRNEQFRRQTLKGPGYNCDYVCTLCLEDAEPEWVHRSIAFAVGIQCVGQVATRPDGPLAMGFGNWSETAVCGSPALVCGLMVYGKEGSRAVEPTEDWGLLVKKRLTTRKATPLADLLKADTEARPQAVHAERWTLVGLLNQQPAKFGKLLLALKESDSDLAAIEKVYGWNEMELKRQWRNYVTSPAKRTAGKRL